MKLILSKKRNSLTYLILLAFLMSLVGPVVPSLAADIPPAPLLISPANLAKVVAVGSGDIVAPPVAMPEFSWQPVAGATMYQIQVASDIGFGTLAFDDTTPLTHYLNRDVSRLRDGNWYWRVRVTQPVQGPYSEGNAHRIFTKQWASPQNIPILVSPADASTLEFYNAPTFSWQPVVGAARYKFQVSTSDTFTSLTYERQTITTTHQPEFKLANGASYYWRVVPLDPANQEGTPSASRTFNMYYGKGPAVIGEVSPTDQVPDLLTPANSSFPTFTPSFSWTAVRGAQYYLLQYSTDPELSSGISSITTRNTTYTPESGLPNDVNYYWRVRAHSGQSVSDWSTIWTFQKQWYIRPVLLTPTNLFQDIRIPTFSWAPVPGAAYYRIELSSSTDFNSPLQVGETANPFYTPNYFTSTWTLVYWRVIPFDAGGYRGKESLVSSFRTGATKLTPELISPQFYYVPNSFPAPYTTVAMQPYIDRTVNLPVFYWHRLTDYPTGVTAAAAYRLEVATTPGFELDGSTVWTVITQNTHAAPDKVNNFSPTTGQDYFWRVHGLDSSGFDVGNYSQTWRTRFNIQPNNNPTAPPPQLRRPVAGTEIVEATPLFEWWPVTGADEYQVQISLDPTFATVINSDYVFYPVYSPIVSLAQRSLNVLNYGTYYWRVQARSNDNPLGSWSEVRRFQIASQSGRVKTRTMGSTDHRLKIASDPVDANDPNYELTTLYAMQDIDAWYVGFNATTDITNMTYLLYVDMDHVDNSGAPSGPPGYSNITTIPAHQPEFAIYIRQIGQVFSAAQTSLYTWNEIDWGFPQSLTSIGGELLYDDANDYLEVKIPNTAIGMSEVTGSYAFSLFSVPAVASGVPQDSVPSDATIPGNGPIGRFASSSERMNMIQPANTPIGDATAYPFVIPFEWEYPEVDNPTLVDGTVPWTGGWTRVYLDPGFTQERAQYETVSNSPYYTAVSHHWPYDFLGDNTYYWRIQPCYTFPGMSRICGAWNQGGRFERRGFVPSNLTESVTFSTPTFSWSQVEGGRYYELQLGTDSNLSQPLIQITTAQNSYTPTSTLNEGTYFWRVRVQRYNGSTSNWTAPKSFTLTLPKPSGLTPNNPDKNSAIGTTPTYCWQPLLESSNGIPVLAAYSYRLQVSKGDPNFSAQNIVTLINTEQNCFTPQNGYAEGQYYWRVAIIDGQGRVGSYSPAATFWKQYPMPEPALPANGSTVGLAPVFEWTANDGVTPYVFGAASYRIKIRRDSPSSDPIENITTNNTRYIPNHFFEINKTYYWEVSMIDADGIEGPPNTALVIINPYPNKVFLPMVVR